MGQGEGAVAPHDAFDDMLRRLVDDVLTTPGTGDPARRRAAFDAATAIAHDPDRVGEAALTVLPPELGRFVDTIARHAYRVTDRMVAGLLADGYPEDEVFELILAAAAGAGTARWELGTRAIQEATRAAG